MNLLVKLVLSPSAQLTVTPDADGVSPSPGGIPLVWMRDPAGANFRFDADSVSGLGDPPFSPPSYDPASNTVTVIDHYTGSAPGAIYHYSLTVKAGNIPYTAGGSPNIRNR